MGRLALSHAHHDIDIPTPDPNQLNDVICTVPSRSPLAVPVKTRIQRPVPGSIVIL